MVTFSWRHMSLQVRVSLRHQSLSRWPPPLARPGTQETKNRIQRIDVNTDVKSASPGGFKVKVFHRSSKLDTFKPLKQSNTPIIVSLSISLTFSFSLVLYNCSLEQWCLSQGEYLLLCWWIIVHRKAFHLLLNLLAPKALHAAMLLVADW